MEQREKEEEEEEEEKEKEKEEEEEKLLIGVAVLFANICPKKRVQKGGRTAEDVDTALAETTGSMVPRAHWSSPKVMSRFRGDENMVDLVVTAQDFVPALEFRLRPRLFTSKEPKTTDGSGAQKHQRDGGGSTPAGPAPPPPLCLPQI